MMDGCVVIRDLESGDQAVWRGLWGHYLAFYDMELPEAVTAFTWARLMDPNHPMKARVALRGGQVLGFAIHMHHASTWVAGDDCYLEDLFVSAEARGQGLGRALIADLMNLARARGWQRLYWHTDEDNAAARRLYDSIVPSDGHIRYRLGLQAAPVVA